MKIRNTNAYKPKAMKNITLLIIAILGTTIVNAQSLPGLEQFTGTWKYENPDSNEVFIIKLKTMTDDFDGELCVCGNYFYSKNNVVIEDNLSQFDTLADCSSYSINAYKSRVYDYLNTKLRLTFTDITYYNKFSGGVGSFIEIIPWKKEIMLHWYLVEEEGSSYVYLENEPMPPYGFSVPTDVILIKEEE